MDMMKLYNIHNLLLMPCFFFGVVLAIENQTSICLTQTCNNASEHLLLNMDLSANPCYDFNRFACGGFSENNFVDEKIGEVTEFTKAEKLLNNKIKRLLRNRSLPIENEFDTDAKIRNFYDGCKIFKSQDKDGIFGTPLQSTLNKIGIGGWPYSNETWKDNVQWYHIVANMVKEGVVFADGIIELPVVNLEVGINDFNESLYSLKIDQPDFDAPLDRETLLENTNEYFERLIIQIRDGIIKFLDLDIDLLEEALRTSIQIEKIMAMVSDDSKNIESVRKHSIYRQDDRNYTTVTIDDLPDLPCGDQCDRNNTTWQNYIQSLFEAAGISHITIHGKDNVIVKNIDYINRFAIKLREAEIKPWEWANYLGFKLLRNFQVAQRTASEEFEDKCENYLVSGKKVSRYGLLHGAVGSMYIRKYFNEETKKEIRSLVDYVKKGFEECICNNPSFRWMDNPTQKAALEKVEAMQVEIAYPPELLNRTTIDTFYKGM